MAVVKLAEAESSDCGDFGRCNFITAVLCK